MKKFIYKSIWGIGWLLAWGAVPILSLVVIGPILAPLLPVGLATVAPAVLAGLTTGLAVKMVTITAKWYKRNYINTQENINITPISTKIKKYATTTLTWTTVLPVVWKYILKPVFKLIKSKIENNIINNNKINNFDKMQEELLESRRHIANIDKVLTLLTQENRILAEKVNNLEINLENNNKQKFAL